MPVESEKKRDKGLVRTLPAAKIMTVWVRLGGKFYLSAVIEDVPTRGGSAIKLRAVEGEVLRKGPGMTADELVAQAFDGASGEVEVGEVSDTGSLQSLQPRGKAVQAEVRVGVNTLWLRVESEEDAARLKKLRVGAEVTFQGMGAVMTAEGTRHVIVNKATIK
ncbi:MAG: hypothetical protein JKY65_31480 [Planctomycetes bacterium]|nr:hypothetical protein [Planctomycetota bacterium]